MKGKYLTPEHARRAGRRHARRGLPPCRGAQFPADYMRGYHAVVPAEPESKQFALPMPELPTVIVKLTEDPVFVELTQEGWTVRVDDAEMLGTYKLAELLAEALEPALAAMARAARAGEKVVTV